MTFQDELHDSRFELESQKASNFRLETEVDTRGKLLKDMKTEVEVANMTISTMRAEEELKALEVSGLMSARKSIGSVSKPMMTEGAQDDTESSDEMNMDEKLATPMRSITLMDDEEYGVTSPLPTKEGRALIGSSRFSGAVKKEKGLYGMIYKK